MVDMVKFGGQKDRPDAKNGGAIPRCIPIDSQKGSEDKCIEMSTFLLKNSTCSGLASKWSDLGWPVWPWPFRPWSASAGNRRRPQCRGPHQGPWVCNISRQGWGLLSQFSPFRYFPIFPNDQNSGYLYDIKFIFGRCHRSWAAETPGKYEHDWTYLTYTFAKSKFPVTEKLANGTLVTPFPGPNGWHLANNSLECIFLIEICN